ncbi:alcohol dehydrogenase [Aspergillus japonicus CBS 114.51]|uniref:D-xylulose reductase n=2 Tax=Aspergillus TaxID=5052 RepID=A0A2V5IH77_ASPV1|nr:alcohol dehydrogenase [Aspergillus japonicus CBS 114.51]PYI19036.1 alcohol dehydrogenase [Aspergillus violaceofuscus CBS 115571]RAH86774.1 alcohol dehydrogenase [Aspergillus japonicus CBS 114.51]
MQNPSFVLQDIKKVTIEDRPVPELQDPHDVLVHVAQTGICGSDVHYWQRGRIGDYVVTGPMVLGHESSGVIAAVGDAVTHLKSGDRVAVEPGLPCRRCDYCRRGSYHLCPGMIFAATPPYDGTLAKYYVTAADFCYKVPEHMDLEQAAMVEPVSVAVAIAKTADLRPHQTVLVLGCGPIGVLCQAVAKAYGASKVIGVDVVESRLEVAKTYGADETFLAPFREEGVEPLVHAERVAALVKERCGLGDGADVVLECSGAEACVQLGVLAARPGGTYVQAGMGKENVLFPITTVCVRGLVVKGSIRYLPGCYPAAIELISTGKIDVKKLVTNRFKFEQAEEAFELVRQGRQDVFKVMISGVGY